MFVVEIHKQPEDFLLWNPPDGIVVVNTEDELREMYFFLGSMGWSLHITPPECELVVMLPSLLEKGDQLLCEAKQWMHRREMALLN